MCRDTRHAQTHLGTRLAARRSFRRRSFPSAAGHWDPQGTADHKPGEPLEDQAVEKAKGEAS